MKKLILISLISAFSVFAKAGNEGAQAAPPAGTYVLAEYHASGGLFVPPNMPYAYRYQILSNGRGIVLAYSQKQQQPVAKVLKNYTPSETLYISNLVSKVKPGALYDANPNEQGCQDAPTFTFSVHSQQYGEIKIGQNIMCKEMKRKNASAVDKLIVEKLKELERLNRQTGR